ncbi:MAG: L-aspartate oxidase, partial [Candidatus Peregrinibacteria bacterium]|nr:L-aspartate oxidase [Candidatus Peregrinibacteria bacterium]
MTHYDTIIIGSGIAGLNFALNAAEHGQVLVITKKRTAMSSTNRAQGGIAAVLDKTDQFKQHVEDTLEAGSHHNVKKAVEFMVKNGPEAIMRLVEMGVPFATDKQGELLLTREGGHQKRRIAFVGDYTGQEIESALVRQVTSQPNITIWEYSFAVDLLVKEGICYGVQIIHNDKTTNLFAANTVIATGGIGQIYRYTTNPIISLGDGIAMGLRVGLKTKDMEFIQFHPTALNVRGRTKFLLSEALRGEGAYLRNNAGKRFMVGVHKLAELAPRDVVAREVYREDLAGGAFLDMCHLNAKEVKLRFPQIYQKCKSYDLDLTKNRIPISPAAHYCCGGLITNIHGETSIEGLYAFGEVSWTGVHGANRLASNSLLEALVFSSQIIQKIKTRKLSTQHPRFPKPTYRKSSDNEWQKLRRIRTKIQKIMWEKVGIVRQTEQLQKAIDELEILKTKLPQH